MSATDRFGNLIDFKALPKETACPNDEIGKGGLLSKVVKDSEGKESTIQYPLDVCHIQRGRDEKTSSKGWRYWGISAEPKNETEAEEFIAKFGEFFSYKYIAARVITTFNIENQRFCELSVTKQWPDNDLLETLATRAMKGESANAALKGIKEIAAELQALTPGSPEHLAKMLELAAASQKLIA